MAANAGSFRALLPRFALVGVVVFPALGCQEAASGNQQACDVFYDDLRPAYMNMMEDKGADTLRQVGFHGERLDDALSEVDEVGLYRAGKHLVGVSNDVAADKDGSFEAFLMRAEPEMRSECQRLGLE